MSNIVLVVWRESLEAMLVVGILHAWLRENDTTGRGRLALWAGVAGGLLLALGLGWGIVAAQSALAGDALEFFQTAVLFIAAALIAQMVIWMARHGRGMRSQLEGELAEAATASNWFGVAVIAALTVAREGAETVIFLYGVSFAEGARAMWFPAATGIALATATAVLAGRGLRFARPAVLLRVSGLVLLLFASALLVAGVDRLIGNGTLPPLVEPLWNTSGLLDDSIGAGRIAADLAGYRAQPSLMLLLAWLAYWAACLSGLRWARLAR